MTEVKNVLEEFKSVASELTQIKEGKLDNIVKELILLERDMNIPGSEKSTDDRVNKLIEHLTKVEIE